MTKEMYTPQIKIVEFSEEDVVCESIPAGGIGGDHETEEAN